MQPIELVQLTQIDDDIILQAAYKFCQGLAKSKADDFAWPKILMGAHNIIEFRNGIDILSAEERLIPQDFIKHGYVPQTLLWARNCKTKVFIGIANVRLVLTPQMLRQGGHVEIGIEERRRGQGYGAEVLRQVLNYCANHKLYDVLLTADVDNFAGRRMIEKCGGRPQDVITHDRQQIARYWVHCD